MSPVCSIVIRAFNEENHISRLLDGISHQSVKDVQVILVDSGSTDRTAQIAKERGVEIVGIAPKEFTFGRSLNKGIARAEGPIIVVASAHVYPVYPDWLEKLIDLLKDPAIALVYGKQRGSESSHFSERQIFLHWYGETTQNPQDHPFCNNANAAIRKDLWEQHQYDEKLPGLEDLEWAKWAIDNHHRIAYCAEAEIIHVHGESSKGIQNRYMREGMAFKQIYPHERFSLGDLVRLFVTNSASDLKESIRQKNFFKEMFNILRFRWFQFYGTYIGYQRSGPLTWRLKQSFYYPRNSGVELANGNLREVEPIEYKNNRL
jgi:glycosyltransferase involved in cell wall biosynthesis